MANDADGGAILTKTALPWLGFAVSVAAFVFQAGSTHQRIETLTMQQAALERRLEKADATDTAVVRMAAELGALREQLARIEKRLDDTKR